MYTRGGLHSLGKRGEVAELCIPQTRNNISKKKLIFEQHDIVSIHINFYENRFINECARKNIAKILIDGLT